MIITKLNEAVTEEIWKGREKENRNVIYNGIED